MNYLLRLWKTLVRRLEKVQGSRRDLRKSRT